MARFFNFNQLNPSCLSQLVDEAVNLERANWVEECGRINAAYAAARATFNANPSLLRRLCPCVVA